MIKGLCDVVVWLRVSSSFLDPADPSLRALSGRLKFTVRRHNFNKDSLFLAAAPAKQTRTTSLFTASASENTSSDDAQARSVEPGMAVQWKVGLEGLSLAATSPVQRPSVKETDRAAAAGQARSDFSFFWIFESQLPHKTVNLIC